MKFRNAKASIIALALAASVPALVHAQDAREPVRTEAQDNQMDFGWLGLLGLAGLFGLKRRDREQDIVRDSDRVAVNRGR